MSFDLKETVALMRELGVTRYRTDSFEIELGAPPTPITPRKPADTEVSEIERKQREWDTFWRKANRSSGAAIPPYPRQRPSVEPAK